MAAVIDIGDNDRRAWPFGSGHEQQLAARAFATARKRVAAAIDRNPEALVRYHFAALVLHDTRTEATLEPANTVGERGWSALMLLPLSSAFR